VWFDALIAYLLPACYGTNDFLNNWPADIQVIRKNMLAFHSIIWLAFCFALDIPLPEKIFAHGSINDCKKAKNGKISSCVNLLEVIDEFGSDTLRYYLLREVDPEHDFNFSVEEMIKIHNSELVNGFGNLVYRSLSMLEKFNNNIVPRSGDINSEDEELERFIVYVKNEYKNSINSLNFQEALKTVNELIYKINQYIDKTAPWELHAENNTGRLNTVLYTLTDCMRILIVLLHPFIPKTANKIWKQMGFNQLLKSAKHDSIRSGVISPGQRIEKIGHIFTRIEDPEE
jgi:methionyl-tRNA synthetase